MLVVKNYILEMTVLNITKEQQDLVKKRTQALESDRLDLNSHLAIYYMTTDRLLTLSLFLTCKMGKINSGSFWELNEIKWKHLAEKLAHIRHITNIVTFHHPKNRFHSKSILPSLANLLMQLSFLDLLPVEEYSNPFPLLVLLLTSSPQCLELPGFLHFHLIQ